MKKKNIVSFIALVVIIGLLIFLGQEVKKSVAVAIPLFAFLVLLVIHVAQIATVAATNAELLGTLYRCLALDFLFILVTFFGYLWVDDIESKFYKKKSIDNSLDWFWKEV